MKFLHLILFFWLIPYMGSGQSYEYTRYSEKDGLKSRFVYSINQDAGGNLLVGTGEGLYSYDGFSFREFNTDKGLINNFITCSEKDAQGGIWFGHDNGALTYLLDDRIDTINLSEFTHSRINQIVSRENELWVLTQNDGLLCRNAKNQWQQFKDGLDDFTLYSFHIDRFNRIWLGTDIGLLLLEISGKTFDYTFIDEISGSKVSCILPQNDKLLIGTEDLGIFILQLNEKDYNVDVLRFEEEEFNSYHVNSLFLTPIGDLWICSNNKGVLQLSAMVNGAYRKRKEHAGIKSIQSQSIRTCTMDREGNIWIGTMGEGLFKLQDSYLTLLSDKSDELRTVYSIFERNDTIWYGEKGEIKICYKSPDNIIDLIDGKNGLPDDAVTSMFIDTYGVTWIGTNEHGLFKLPRKGGKLRAVLLPTGGTLPRINAILIQKNIVYIASNYGVYQFLNDKLISHITIQSGLAVNTVKALYKDVKSSIWLATTTSQLSYLQGGEIKNMPSGIIEAPANIRCITEDNTGRIWVGTDGLGVLCISGDTLQIINKSKGLYSDYCYSIVCDQRNNLWVGHQGALTKINSLNGKIEVFDPSGQLNTDFMDNAVFKTSSGSILFGTSNGLLRYDPENDTRNEVEPVLRMENITINDTISSTTDKLALKYGKYNIRFDFIGISLKNAAGVRYQYFLEGYDNDWLPLTSQGNVSYNKLAPGNYVFHVRCYNSDGYGGYTELAVPVFLDKPFWQKWWFIAMCVITALLTMRFVIKRRERLYIENQKRLQNALDEATREVVEQKELLEIKNKDITDSILYAKNIQQAMLPSTSQLSEYFNEAFVLFKPRDIVSGDFYWVERFKQHIVVACADCTGHGVPGAFMSLIGSTLLKDVAGLAQVQSSADVLSILDTKLKEVLHKQSEAVSIHDGMDISVMDYNVDTKILRVASANRPVILYHKGEWVELRGDRQSIGGDIGEKKVFSIHEFEMQSGDAIYMFSDGITDQFGGAFAKKLKRSGLRAWLEESVHSDMHEQLSVISEHFNQWKGKEAQIDDVILVGIRF
jgi:ligand-binding sensor domain-containing protein/serine phosphatase RsbU (regulator of sigma subunit)